MHTSRQRQSCLLEMGSLKGSKERPDLSLFAALPGNASYYYSISRLKTDGKLQLGENQYTVTGLSWLDREWSNSALSKDQVGWDWFALQFDDGSDLMIYQLRRKDGSTDPLSAGTWIAVRGTVYLSPHTWLLDSKSQGDK